MINKTIGVIILIYQFAIFVDMVIWDLTAWLPLKLSHTEFTIYNVYHCAVIPCNIEITKMNSFDSWFPFPGYDIILQRSPNHR